jgi:hypothetical protein
VAEEGDLLAKAREAVLEASILDVLERQVEQEGDLDAAPIEQLADRVRPVDVLEPELAQRPEIVDAERDLEGRAGGPETLRRGRGTGKRTARAESTARRLP